MSDVESDSGTPDEKIPFMQQLLDSPLVLLAIGVIVPMVLYVMWGMIEIISIPLAS